ncbi:MAG: 4Fe-4S dicluster domain-containing protein [Anaerolineales bacterium]|nr:4Fe-4S dicluster domain-containing protein [Anaerolineales bacterium]
MLSLIEKIIFGLGLVVSGYFAWRGFYRIFRIISAGKGQPDWKLIPGRLAAAAVKFISLEPTWKLRIGASFFHALIAWGFSYYLLVNLQDVVGGYFPDFKLFGDEILDDIFRLGADIFTVSVAVGILYMFSRRFIFKSRVLLQSEDTLLHPKARSGILRDSAIVGAFTFMHVGFRFLGESFLIASSAHTDPWQPMASSVASLWGGWSGANLEIGIHLSFWITQGLVLFFLPYLPWSKHIHLFFAPLNFLLKPERRSMGELTALDFEDESVEQFGAIYLEDLGYEQFVDAYACIMCNRCTEVCPANQTGKALSPAAMEINKRYLLNYEGDKVAAGDSGSIRLIDSVITEEAVWACTSCAACIDICPVGNEPMRDILDIRRGLVLMENKFPETLQTAFRGMERTANPWNVPSEERMKWAEGLDVPTVEQNPNPEYLWWVGCGPSTDSRAQKTARAFAEILNHAGVDYAVLGKKETCTGDSARRAGNEYLFSELATNNVALFNEIQIQKILTTCPHCLHTIKNEYPAFGGELEVVHHTTLINELIGNGQLEMNGNMLEEMVTFHDPCYLGRQNDILIDPRSILQHNGAKLVEMPRSGNQSFCCGAGGAQMWKEEEHGTEAVKDNRFREAEKTKAGILAVGCPFCMIMMNDAAKDAGSEMQVMDVAEIVAKRLK